MSGYNDGQYNTDSSAGQNGGFDQNGWSCGGGDLGGQNGQGQNYQNQNYQDQSCGQGYDGQYYNSAGRTPGRRLYKSRTNRMICGVCAGIAEYFGWDPTLVRLLWIGASLLLGAGIMGLVVYFIVAVVMPEGM